MHASSQTARQTDRQYCAIVMETCCSFASLCWRLLAFVPSQGMVMECREACHVPLNVLMVYPNQASSLQGSHCGNGDILAVNVSDNGSGWRQSTQNGALLVPRGGIVNQNRMWLPLTSVTCTTPPFLYTAQPQLDMYVQKHTD